jgi:hypothetical protein
MRFSIFMIIKTGILCAALVSCQKSPSRIGEFNWAVGAWHGTRTAADDGSTIPMTAQVESASCGLIERLQVETTPKPYVGFTLRSLDPASGKWTMIYANSTRPNIGRLEGKLEGNRSTWNSITATGSHGSRFVSEQLDVNRWRRTQLVSDDAGKTWRVLFTDELIRDQAGR